MKVFDVDYEEILNQIVEDVLKHIEKITGELNEKDKKESIKIMDKLEELTERLEEKSEIFFDNEIICTKENLQKLLNLYKQQEDFFDSAIKKANIPNKY